MTYCEFDDETMACRFCGYKAKSPKTIRECRQHQSEWRPIAVGDLVEKALSSAGITPDRVERLTGRKCGCKQRKQWMNDAGYKAQAVVRDAGKAVAKFYFGE